MSLDGTIIEREAGHATSPRSKDAPVGVLIPARIPGGMVGCCCAYTKDKTGAETMHPSAEFWGQWISAWSQWLSGNPIDGSTMIGPLSLRGWGRFGRLMEVPAVAVLLFDIIGPERLRLWGDSVKHIVPADQLRTLNSRSWRWSRAWLLHTGASMCTAASVGLRVILLPAALIMSATLDREPRFLVKLRSPLNDIIVSEGERLEKVTRHSRSDLTSERHVAIFMAFQITVAVVSMWIIRPYVPRLNFLRYLMTPQDASIIPISWVLTAFDWSYNYIIAFGITAPLTIILIALSLRLLGTILDLAVARPIARLFETNKLAAVSRIVALIAFGVGFNFDLLAYS